MIFNDLLIQKDGMIKGPFGSAVKKSLFVPKSSNTYKVYEQGVVANGDFEVGNYYLPKDYIDKSLSRFFIEEGDILLTGAGTLGLLAIVPKGIEKGIMNQALIRIRLNEEIIYKPYFMYYFPWAIKEFACRINGNSVIPNLPPLDVLKKIEVDIPSIERQKQIADKLNLITDKISNNNAVCNDLESMAKLLYNYWFVQFDFPDKNGKPYKSSGGKMVWNEELKREIPDGWEVKSLSEICNLSNGINYDKNEQGDKEYKIVNVRNITATSLLLDEEGFDRITLKSSLGDKYLIHKNDILIARSGTPGAIRLLEEVNDNTIYCGFIIRCSLYDKALRNYICFYLKMFEGTNATKTGGSILQNVSQDTLNMIKIPIPKSDLITIFNQSTTLIIKSMQNSINENQELASLRDFLLPMLMNGQVKIK